MPVIYTGALSQREYGEPDPKREADFEKLNAMLKIKSTLALYKDFYKQMGILEMFHMPAKDTGMGGCVSISLSSCSF